ncbi:MULTISPECIES: MarR family transcriptional regulator [unclassified Paenibacillus]|uniref:MarR family winged helix-turn-helix transcriptional regulator n=1 Tax=unclassified Paenibacillus TaxID=185978 RepID=UPI002405C1E2|nr:MULTISPECIES: MarR family transcriptional regulator [unclassified Paenibacillus]MDF9844748.1 MarR family transcriptional repressor of mepA [Paenibacillus sp. PastF-2]MDF9851350.1 MarR family transcriptional repressor of mepA [Paenibacillus sp. PastM-2]MDF9857932.1 MarR family transcriptional repressor of mepA [Paenibacillus sp. PastF-1]MDH6483199.1 MarR family transcriptional repressor of mepA [Paenibacillus sp. PastH-2]MDH6510610.1 MarR family transcriptional repressor of mepA [Paenibacill
MEKQSIYTPYSDLIRSIGMNIRNMANARLSELGLNTQQGQMMGYIFENQDKGVIQRDLAEHFGRKGATITSMLQGLEKKGYVKRVIPKDNERQKKIYLLQKGIDLVEEFNDIFMGVERRITQGLTESESVTLMELLNKVKKTM